MAKQNMLLFAGILAVFLLVPMLVGRVCPMGSVPYVQKAQPPKMVFAVVWPLLYLCCAISFYILYMNNSKNTFAKYAMAISVVSFVINVAYIYATGCGKDWKMGLWLLTAYTILVCVQMMTAFAAVPLAGIFVAPLLGWCVFALNANVNIVNNL
jgi:tryptophan-rich sensory protein